MEIKNLSLDLETKSSVDIGKAGAYKYAESPDFDILLFGVSVNHGPITVYVRGYCSGRDHSCPVR